jgi:chemotaxis protein histidine kinase CheA
MHKLRGSAAMLGAEPVRRAAQRAEQALNRDADGDEVAVIMSDLASSLRALADRTRPLLAKHLSREARSDHAPAQPAPIDATDVADLRALLAAQDLSALGRFGALSGSLRAALGDERFDRLRLAVNALDFEQAVGLLDELPSNAPAFETAAR